MELKLHQSIRINYIVILITAIFEHLEVETLPPKNIQVALCFRLGKVSEI
jgi:hypothetical protein